MKKQLSTVAVSSAMLLLMDAHPQNTTTTLEVKTLLRSLGYEADQKDVSNLMDDLYNELDITYKLHTSDSGNTFRVYSFLEDEEDYSGVPQFTFTIID